MAGVLASDASSCGFGVAVSFWDISDVATVSRVPEVRRWRCAAVPAGRHAFESAGFRVGSCSGEVRAGRDNRFWAKRDRFKFSRNAVPPALESIVEKGRS